MEQKLSPVLKPLFKIFKVSNLEELIKKLLKLGATPLADSGVQVLVKKLQ